MSIKKIFTDCLVIGSGAAGLYAALHAGRYGSVTVVTKTTLSESSSYYAQGGVAAVLHSKDSIQNHYQDTFIAGRETGSPDAINTLVTEGADDVLQLVKMGMEFDKKNGTFDLGLEGGHSQKRILHRDGASTGKALIQFLLEQIRKRDNIDLQEESFACNLVTNRDNSRCYGADVYRYKKKELFRIESKAVILASGGYSGLYSRTTNPHTSTGDGLWLAQRAGVPLKNLEFIQFHPTAFYSDSGRTFLISEALRGEGARLYNCSGDRFMATYPEKELMPRDVVSREIFHQIEQSGENFVYLDMQHLDGQFIRTKYPELTTEIETRRLNIERDYIPVAPAAHYCIGGVETDLHGATALNGLYACGETAYTGVHGANRLASNSLLECLVFGRRAAQHAASNYDGYSDTANCAPFKMKIQPDIADRCSAALIEISEILNRYAGVVRDQEGLETALDQLKKLKLKMGVSGESTEFYQMKMDGALHIAEKIIFSALKRKESLGVHNRRDDNQSTINSMKTNFG